MEVLALIATALAAGAAAGVHDSASAAVRDMYERLRRLGAQPGELDSAVAAQRKRDDSASDPVAPELRRLLEAVQAGEDEELRSLAAEVRRHSQKPTVTGAQGGTVWNISISESQVAAIGDGTNVRNIYNAAPSSSSVIPEEA
ncbi:hypothetical protein ACIPSE_05775 [Streptomyces sp. NPDC090106]|uniref:hypothetical protein n=1 Tax=Streptomyces sp. NPDC090106 TaxID=3365946 RepID=UPI0037FED9A4